jgi:hypothetical protein
VVRTSTLIIMICVIFITHVMRRSSWSGTRRARCYGMRNWSGSGPRRSCRR